MSQAHAALIGACTGNLSSFRKQRECDSLLRASWNMQMPRFDGCAASRFFTVPLRYLESRAATWRLRRLLDARRVPVDISLHELRGRVSLQNRANIDNLPRRPAAGRPGGHCSTRFASYRGKNYGKDDTELL